MIDLHSHILPGIDDGARDQDESLALAKMSYEQGVTHMLCTPHIHQGTFDNSKQSIEAVFDKFVSALKEHAIDLKVAFSCEVRLGIEITAWIDSESLPFLGEWEGKKALLLELPHSHIPPGTERLIAWLDSRGVQAVIPHPERNREILNDYHKSHWLKRSGAIFQLTAGALGDTFGDKVKTTAWQMLDDGLIAYVASDMHNLKRRPNQMAQAYQLISQQKSEALAEQLCVSVPASITRNTHWC